MKKILAIVLTMALIAALGVVAFASGDPAPAASEEAAGTVEVVFKEATATEYGWIFVFDAETRSIVDVKYIEPLGPEAAAAENLASWKAYVMAYALAGAPNEEEGQTVAGLIDEAATVEDVNAIAQLTVLFESVGVLPYTEWVDAGMPAADTSAMGAASEEASGEADASAEPAGDASAEPAGDASAEPAGDASAEPAGDASAEPAGDASAEPAGDASAEPAAEQPAPAPAVEEPAPAEEEAPAEGGDQAVGNPNYDPEAHNWASIEIVMVIIILVVGAVLMLSFGKKKD